MSTVAHEAPVKPARVDLDRGLPASEALTWLRKGWRDFTVQPGASLAYGVLVFAVSVITICGLFAFGFDYILFPALAGFMVVGPVLAIGLYEKSRRLAEGRRASLAGMIFVKAASTGQILFTGALLMMLMLVWMRAAVIIYALFFGWQPFVPGLGPITAMLFGTPLGLAMLVVGSLVGALFAAFSFAISAFSIPMLLDRRVDAFTAMGKSMALVWNNLPVMLAWGAIVLALFLASLVTGLLGLIITFPVLGHGTWHAYKAIAQEE